MSSIPTLGYWDIRGRAQPIRYLLKLAGAPFNDKRYQFGAEVGKQWSDDKCSLGLDFPNLPYYIDGDLKLTQSLTILKYLARKHGLIAKDEKTLAKQEMVEQQIHDIRMKLFSVIVSDDYLEKKLTFIKETLSPQLEQLVKFLGSNEWLTSKLSYVDILAYETLDSIRLFTPETIEKFPALVQYLTRFENLEPIKAYCSSPEYKDWPLFGPIVKWGFSK